MRHRLRVEAKGEDCMIRLPGTCNFDPETTVLAHIRRGAGMGRKPTDLCGVYACSACHDVIDGRSNVAGYTKEELDGYILDALIRQLAYWESRGSVAIRA